MENDFLRSLGHLGVPARLKRLSDTLTASIKDLYRANGVDIEPSWHLVFLYLEKQPTATVTEIAGAFHISQPAMTKMINRMIGKGYLDVVRDASDGRKKNIRLSSRAHESLPTFKRIWRSGQASIQEILGPDAELLRQLTSFEAEIGRRGFVERAMERLDDG